VGVLLWLLPIPLGRDKATVSATFEIVNPNGESLWSHVSSHSASKIFTLYNSNGASTSSTRRIEIKKYGSNKIGIDGHSLWAYHAEALREAMGEAKASMAEYFAAANEAD